jgi:hypothetical protein
MRPLVAPLLFPSGLLTMQCPVRSVLLPTLAPVGPCLDIHLTLDISHGLGSPAPGICQCLLSPGKPATDGVLVGGRADVDAAAKMDPAAA